MTITLPYASVHIRQDVADRRTLFYLEHLILRHNAAADATHIAEAHFGLDFFFPSRIQAQTFVDFIGKFVPIRHSDSKELATVQPNPRFFICNFIFNVEICPICRDDLIILPFNISQYLGNLGPLVVCTKVTNSMITLVERLTMRTCFVDRIQYWKATFKSHLSRTQLVKYIVFNIDTDSTVRVAGSNYVLATVTVARLTDQDNICTIKTHLSHLLKPGDHALGYDLQMGEFESLVSQEVLLIEKIYTEKMKNVEKKEILKDSERRNSATRGIARGIALV